MTILAAAVLAAPSGDLKGAASSGAGQQNDSAFAAVFDRIASKTAADKDAPQSGLASALPPGQKGGTPALPGSLERPSRHDRPAGSDRNAATGRSPVPGDDQQQLGSILTTPPQGLGLGLAALAQAAVPPQQSPPSQQSAQMAGSGLPGANVPPLAPEQSFAPSSSGPTGAPSPLAGQAPGPALSGADQSPAASEPVVSQTSPQNLGLASVPGQAPASADPEASDVPPAEPAGTDPPAPVAPGRVYVAVRLDPAAARAPLRNVPESSAALAILNGRNATDEPTLPGQPSPGVKAGAPRTSAVDVALPVVQAGTAAPSTSPAQQIAAALQTFVPRDNPAPTPSGEAGPAAPGVADLQAASTASGIGPKVREMTIQLAPDNLGAVSIHMRITADKVDVRIVVENMHTLEILNKDRHVLSAAIEAVGGGPGVLGLGASPRLEAPGGGQPGTLDFSQGNDRPPGGTSTAASGGQAGPGNGRASAPDPSNTSRDNDHEPTAPAPSRSMDRSLYV